MSKNYNISYRLLKESTQLPELANSQIVDVKDFNVFLLKTADLKLTKNSPTTIV